MTASAKNVSQKPVSNDTGVRNVPVPPDGGWGWVVTFSSFMVSVLVDGVCFSFGIFFTEFMDYFQASKMKTSWVGSVLNGSYMVVGPVVGSLVTKYGCRRIAFIGAFIASTSFFISTFSPSIEVLTVTYGLIGGVGLGFMYLPAIVMVGYYFEKRRALATGIACCGSGIGAFVFAPLCEFLLKEYNWQGAIWILSAIVLNALIFIAFYRPVENTSSYILSKGDNSNTLLGGADELCISDEKCRPIMLSNEKLVNSERKHSWELQNSPIYRCRSVDIPTNSNSTEKKQVDTEIAKLAKSQQNFTNKRLNVVKDEFLSPMRRKDIFYSGSLTNLKVYREARTSRDYINKIYDHHSQENVSTEELQSRSGLCSHLCGFIKSNFDFSLLLSPTFSVYGLSCFLCMAGFFVPFMYIPPLALELDISLQKAAYLISIIGMVNTIGRVVTGFISDHQWVDCLLINNVALIIGGAATMLVPVFTSFGLLAAYCCVFGIAIAVFVSLRSIIMVELLGLEKLTSAFGLVIMCQGLSSFIGAPIAGALSDMTGSYDASFYLAGVLLALAGIICLPLRRIAAWEKNKKRPQSDFILQNSNTESMPMITVDITK